MVALCSCLVLRRAEVYRHFDKAKVYRHFDKATPITLKLISKPRARSSNVPEADGPVQLQKLPLNLILLLKKKKLWIFGERGDREGYFLKMTSLFSPFQAASFSHHLL